MVPWWFSQAGLFPSSLVTGGRLFVLQEIWGPVSEVGASRKPAARRDAVEMRIHHIFKENIPVVKILLVLSFFFFYFFLSFSLLPTLTLFFFLALIIGLSVNS